MEICRGRDSEKRALLAYKTPAAAVDLEQNIHTFWIRQCLIARFHSRVRYVI